MFLIAKLITNITATNEVQCYIFCKPDEDCQPQQEIGNEKIKAGIGRRVIPCLKEICCSFSQSEVICDRETVEIS